MRFLLACLLLLPAAYAGVAARAAELVDATGRHVQIPEHVARVLPAGPPAAALLAVLAPDLMVGWPHALSAKAAAWLPDAVAKLPVAPPAQPTDVDAIKAAPDLIFDYGDVSPRYTERDQQLQAATGIPTVLLDGALDKTPEVLRELGNALGRQERAKVLADAVQATLDMAGGGKSFSVVYARGVDGLNVVAPGTIGTQVFELLHWRVLAPAGNGLFRHTSVEEIKTLDPDVLIFADPAARQAIAASPEWRALRAVHEHRAYTAFNLPFGWIEEPGSINRVLGLTWLKGADPGTTAQRLYPLLYGRAIDDAQAQSVRQTMQPIEP